MSLADALTAEAEAPDRRVRCKVEIIVGQMDDADRDAFEAAVSGGVPGTTLQRALRRLGFDLSYATMNRHLNGVCSCDG